jgi:hypothetical protein
MPRPQSLASVVRLFRPRSSVSSTAHSSHIYTLKSQGVKVAEIDELKQQIAELKQQNQAMQAALLQLQNKPELVAHR